MSRIDRRTLLLGSAVLLVAADDDPDARAHEQLDEAAKLPAAGRLPALRQIDVAGLSAGMRLNVTAALRSAELEAAIETAAQPTARYALQLRLRSGTDATPAEAYARSLELARRLTARANRLLRAEGLNRGSVADRLRRLARDPRHLYPDDDSGRDQAVADMNRWLEAARRRLPRQFGIIPAAAAQVSVRRMTASEEQVGKAGYRVLPSFDGRTAGAYYVDLREIRRRPQWTLPSVVHHELLPGHMMQIPWEERAAPHPLRLRAASGFTEGWAVYAEQLAAEAGAYAEDRLAEIGYLQWLLFRLGRAMIDVGINALGWSDAASLAFLFDLQGDPMIFAPFEKDIARVRSEPASYASHVLNWLGIEQLRNAAVRRHGDVRRVHDRLLSFGAAPLVLLAPLLR